MGGEGKGGQEGKERGGGREKRRGEGEDKGEARGERERGGVGRKRGGEKQYGEAEAGEEGGRVGNQRGAEFPIGGRDRESGVQPEGEVPGGGGFIKSDGRGKRASRRAQACAGRVFYRYPSDGVRRAAPACRYACSPTP